MHFNATFTSYRRTETAGIRGYSATATITSGSAFWEPAGGELKGSLGIDFSTKAFSLLTYEADIEIGDRLVISGENYHVLNQEVRNVNGSNLSSLFLTIDK